MQAARVCEQSEHARDPREESADSQIAEACTNSCIGTDSEGMWLYHVGMCGLQYVGLAASLD